MATAPLLPGDGYLLSMTTAECSDLDALRSRLGAYVRGDTRGATLGPSLDLSDAVLLRFVRASGGDLDAAQERWTGTYEWRREFAVDYLLDNWTPPQILREYVA